MLFTEMEIDKGIFKGSIHLLVIGKKHWKKLQKTEGFQTNFQNGTLLVIHEDYKEDTMKAFEQMLKDGVPDDEIHIPLRKDYREDAKELIYGKA